MLIDNDNVASTSVVVVLDRSLESEAIKVERTSVDSECNASRVAF